MLPRLRRITITHESRTNEKKKGHSRFEGTTKIERTVPRNSIRAHRPLKNPVSRTCQGTRNPLPSSVAISRNTESFDERCPLGEPRVHDCFPLSVCGWKRIKRRDILWFEEGVLEEGIRVPYTSGGYKTRGSRPRCPIAAAASVIAPRTLINR